VEQHRVITLYQDRDALIQEVGLSSLARVDSHPLTKIVQEETSWSVDDAQSFIIIMMMIIIVTTIII